MKQLLIECLTREVLHQIAINRCWNSTVILLVAVRVLGWWFTRWLIVILERCSSPYLNFLELILLSIMWLSTRISRRSVVFWLYIFSLSSLLCLLLLMKIGITPSIFSNIDIFSAYRGNQILGLLVRIFAGDSSRSITRYFPASTNYRIIDRVLRTMHHHERVLDFALLLRLSLVLLIVLMMQNLGLHNRDVFRSALTFLCSKIWILNLGIAKPSRVTLLDRSDTGLKFCSRLLCPVIVVRHYPMWVPD